MLFLPCKGCITNTGSTKGVQGDLTPAAEGTVEGAQVASSLLQQQPCCKVGSLHTCGAHSQLLRQLENV